MHLKDDWVLNIKCQKKKKLRIPGVMESGNKEQIDKHAECLKNI